MKTNISIIVFLLLCGCNIQCQNIKKEHKQVSQLQIDTNIIFPILDNAISLFDSTGFTNDSMLFSIDIVKRSHDSLFSLLIEFENSLDMCLNYVRPVYGYFYYRNCLFIVNGIDSERFFLKTKNTKYFEYQPNNSEQLIIIDDSQPYWEYFYYNDEFVLCGESIPYRFRNDTDKE